MTTSRHCNARIPVPPAAIRPCPLQHLEEVACACHCIACASVPRAVLRPGSLQHLEMAIECRCTARARRMHSRWPSPTAARRALLPLEHLQLAKTSNGTENSPTPPPPGATQAPHVPASQPVSSKRSILTRQASSVLTPPSLSRGQRRSPPTRSARPQPTGIVLAPPSLSRGQRLAAGLDDKGATPGHEGDEQPARLFEQRAASPSGDAGGRWPRFSSAPPPLRVALSGLSPCPPAQGTRL